MTIAPLKAVALLTAASLVLAGCSGGRRSPSGTDGLTDTSELHVKTGCDRFFFGGTNPQITRASIGKGVKRLCYRAFAVAYSPVSRTPIWSAEVVDATTVRLARQLPRHDEFHPEKRLASSGRTSPRDDPRAELADYRGSGYDRGHMAPSGDMPTPDAQAESFSLANIVPQAPRLNRGSWAELESDVRDQALDVRRIYVVTGPVFNGKNVGVINDRVMIPSHVWKAILVTAADGKIRGATVYVASNTDYPVWKTMSVVQFSQFSGVNPFPGLPDAVAKANMALGPTPGKGGSGSDGSGSSGGSGVRTAPWDPNNCNAPWRPTNDPHYGECRPITQDEAKYGLVPGTMGASSASTWNRNGASGGGVAPGQAYGSSGYADDGQARFRARDRDRYRDRDRER
jgi:endonuclease G